MKKLSILHLLFLFGYCISIQGQTCIWAEKIGGPGYDKVYGIVTDSNNNIYVAGDFSSDTLKFDNEIFLIKSNTNDGYLAGYSPDGNCKWVIQFEGIKGGRLYDIKSDKCGNVYITGSFTSDTLKFNNGKILIKNEESYRAEFLTKFNNSGECQWAKIFSAIGKIGVDVNGNIYYPIYKESAIYLAKCNSVGELQWEKKFADGSAGFSGIVIGRDGNIYLSGTFDDSLTFDNGDILIENSCKNDYSICADAFIAVLSTMGECQWAKVIGGNIYDVVNSLAIDNGSNVYIAGGFNSDTVRFNDEIFLTNENPEDKWGSKYFNAFLAMYDSTGGCIWAEAIKGDAGEIADQIKLDSAGNIFLSGHFDSISLNFNNDKTLTKKFNNDHESINIFIAKYSNSGKCRWAEKISGYFGLEYVNGMELIKSDIFLTGTFTSLNLYFNNGITLANPTGDFWGPMDVFVAKYSPAISISLKEGWSMISSNIIPEHTELDSILSEIKDKIVIMKNCKGDIYIPEFDINTIGRWNITEGYQVYSSEEMHLLVTGSNVEPGDFAINLAKGWHIVAYLGSEAQSAVDALKSLTDEGVLVIAKDSNGNTYIPAFGINNIGDMLPGQGYQLYLNDNGTLDYPAE